MSEPSLFVKLLLRGLLAYLCLSWERTAWSIIISVNYSADIWCRGVYDLHELRLHAICSLLGLSWICMTYLEYMGILMRHNHGRLSWLCVTVLLSKECDWIRALAIYVLYFFFCWSNNFCKTCIDSFHSLWFFNSLLELLISQITLYDLPNSL